jgi:hypothetical protein
VEGKGAVKTDKKTVTCKLKLVNSFALCGAMQRANSDPDMASLSPSQKKNVAFGTTLFFGQL